MPFYEYECSSCKHHTEVMQKISDPPLRKCPSCGRNTLKKQISAPVFRLKGGGWYETDFKSDTENKRNLADDGGGKEETKTETKVDSKSDSKPAEKAESTPEKKPASKPVRSAKPARKPVAPKKAKRKGR